MGVLAASSLWGCAKWEDKARLYLASTVDVYAVVGNQLLRGKADLTSDRTGTVELGTASGTAQTLTCAGRLAKTGTTAATLDLQCSDGAALVLTVAMLAETQGYGYGQSALGMPVSLTLGLAPQRAVAYLRAPPGQQMVASSKSLFMEAK